MLTFLNVFIFFLKVISDDASLFSDSGSYPSDLDSSDDQSLWSDDSSLGTDDPLPGGSMFDETSPQMLSFDGCSSGGGDLGMVGGDLGIMRKIRRGQVCRPETGTGTQGALEPTNPEPEESPPSPDDQKNNAPDPLHSLPYMPPPSLDGLGCGDVGEQIFIYTVCGSKNRGGPTPSTLIQFRLPTFSVTNAELSKYPKFDFLRRIILITVYKMPLSSLPLSLSLYLSVPPSLYLSLLVFSLISFSYIFSYFSLLFLIEPGKKRRKKTYARLLPPPPPPLLLSFPLFYSSPHTTPRSA